MADDNWFMGSIAAQDKYKPLPWGSDPWVNRIGPTPEMIEQRKAEEASRAAEQRYIDQQHNNADETQAYRGTPRLDPGLRREAGSVWPTPAAGAIGELVGGALVDPLTYSPFGVASKGARALTALGTMGGVFEPTEAEAGVGKTLARGVRASAAEINRAAKESAQGITQPALRKMYEDLGLTGGEPLDLVKRSLAAGQPKTAIDEAIALKLADREALRGLNAQERLVYQKTGSLPNDQLLPSQEAAQAGLDAFKPLKKDITRAEAVFDAGVDAGKRPSLFDLSARTLMKTPNVEQFALPRVAAGMTERLAPATRGGLARVERAAAAAPRENWGWYNLMQARDLFHSLHGSSKGEQAFQAWLDGVAGTSMVNPIDNNLRSSTWYLQQVLQGKALPEVLHLQDPVTGQTVKTMAGGPPAGYGAKSQIQHADRVREYLTNSYDPVSNPKPISYRMNLGGNWVPRTVDTHDIRNIIGMPRALDLFGENAGLLPKEYAYLEQLGGRAAQRAGRPQAAQQAATWVGGGDYTNLKSYPAPLLEALNRRAQVTGAVRGQTAQQALEDAFRGIEALY